jgi:hypothetical protein
VLDVFSSDKLVLFYAFQTPSDMSVVRVLDDAKAEDQEKDGPEPMDEDAPGVKESGETPLPVVSESEIRAAWLSAFESVFQVCVISF